MNHSYSPVSFPNDWTPVSMSSASQVSDNPLDSASAAVGNYCVWNALTPAVSTAAQTFADGNRTVTITGYDCIVNGTIAVDVEDPDGFYAEIEVATLGSTTTWYAGINVNPNARTQATNIVEDANTYLIRPDGAKYNTASSSGYSGTLAANDKLQIVIKGGALYFGKSGTGWADGAGGWTTSDFASATAAFTGLTGQVTLVCANGSTSDNGFTLNAGQTAFTGTQPAGTKLISTANLPTPAVTDPSAYFSVQSYTTTGSDGLTVTGFQDANGTNVTPDLVIQKNRSQADRWLWYDVLRGAGNRISSDRTQAEASESDTLKSFDAGGVTLGNDATNALGINHTASENCIMYMLKAGGAGSSNTDGTITSTVSTADHGCFSILTYTGNGTSGATVGHGLSGAAEFQIFKKTSTANDWHVGTDATGSIIGTELNNTTGTTTAAVTTFGESTTTITNGGVANDNAATYVSFAFRRCPGLIGIGSYTGNGNADGPCIVVDDGGSGFRPAWLMIKRTDAVQDWAIFDAVRDPHNVGTVGLKPNTIDTEYTANDRDFLANGFKLRASGGDINASGSTYIYLAFAEAPFGGAGVSQARAR